MFFACPWCLLLLAPLTLAGLAAWRRRQPALRVSSTNLFAGATPETAAEKCKRHLPLLLAVLGGGFLVLAMARPRQTLEPGANIVQGIDLMLLLDCSGSMAAVDLPAGGNAGGGKLPPARLEAAKRELCRFVETRRHDRLGLIAFARDAFVAAPLTTDHDFLLGRLDELSPDLLPDGTNLAAAIAAATRRLRQSAAPRRVAVLFTDGENTVADLLSPIQAAALAADSGVVLHTVAVGGGQAVLPVPGTPAGRLMPVGAGTDEALLRQLASTSGGMFFKAADAAGFAAVITAVDRLEKTGFEIRRPPLQRELFMPFLQAGALLLFGALLLEHSWLLRQP